MSQPLTSKSKLDNAYNPHMLVMKKCTLMATIILAIIYMIIVVGLSTVAPPMYAFDDYDQEKICPKKYLDVMQQAFLNKKYPEINVTDLVFYGDTLFEKCHTYWDNPDSPVWFGYVTGMNKANQNIYIYGEYKNKPDEHQEEFYVTLKYKLQIRYDKFFSSEPDEVEEDEVEIECELDDDADNGMECGKFSIGFIP